MNKEMNTNSDTDSKIIFNTKQYAEKHGKPPHHNTKGDFMFSVPRHLGKRPYLVTGLTYGEAKKAIIEKIHETQAHGEFVLRP